MVKQTENPYKENTTVFCDGCKRKNIELCAYFYRCSDCSIDLCLQCSFDKCDEHLEIIEDEKQEKENKEIESKVKSNKMLEKQTVSKQLKKDTGKAGKKSK
jgi:hypothetical protein